MILGFRSIITSKILILIAKEDLLFNIEYASLIILCENNGLKVKSIIESNGGSLIDLETSCVSDHLSFSLVLQDGKLN
jgi:hypothetical protein